MPHASPISSGRLAPRADWEQVIRLDLSEMTLVDRPGLQYLLDLTCDEVTLVNCPEYIMRWMDREGV